MSSTVGVVEELRTAPDRWQFLLRLDDDRALVVELRGEIHGTLREGDRIELVDAHPIRSGDVVVARRIANRTLRAPVTAASPGWRAWLLAFMVPQSIWTPLGGFGGALFGYLATGGGGDAAPPGTASPTATPAPNGDGHAGLPEAEPALDPLVIVLVGVVLLGALVLVLLREHRKDPLLLREEMRLSAGRLKLAAVVVAGALVGVAVRLLVS